jgi:aminomethyltransferase
VNGELHQTPLHEWHKSHGGRIVDFAGWSMPVQYSSIVDEHNATRSSVGLFDISHMGRFYVSGDDAGAFLDRVVTRRILGVAAGKIRYALVTNEQGGILDDVLVYHLGGDPARYLLVVNAGNREKIWNWVQSHTDDSAVELVDRTLETAMMAIQGPRALEIVNPLLDFDPNEVGYYSSRSATVGTTDALFSRTGYTGEDGCELIVAKDQAGGIWEQLIESAAKVGGRQAGLGARDTLRLEAAMPLYGHELSESIDPYQAGLSFAVQLKDREFIGREALLAKKNEGSAQIRIGLELEGRRVPREHYSVLRDGKNVGEVTSGTFSPTLQRPIAMAYVDTASGVVGAELTVDIRGSHLPARVVDLPFYSRPI